MNLQGAWLAAWNFAARVHSAQKLPGTDLPYIVHLGTVSMEILIAHHQVPFSRPALAVQCALLHDTLEDTDTSDAELVSVFGEDVANGVRALSKNAHLQKSEALTDSLRRIRQQGPEIWSVKLADRIANLGPPPSHWNAEKVASYAVEARMILDALGGAHEPLAHRLAERIRQYPPNE